MNLFDAFLSDVVNDCVNGQTGPMDWSATDKARSVHGLHADVPNPADPYDEPELRLLAEDDYIAALFGERRRGPEWITYDPLRGVL